MLFNASHSFPFSGQYAPKVKSSKNVGKLVDCVLVSMSSGRIPTFGDIFKKNNALISVAYSKRFVLLSLSMYFA